MQVSNHKLLFKSSITLPNYYSDAGRRGVSAPLALWFSVATVVGRSGFDTSAEVVGTVDECKMRERLRKIPELAVFFGIVFFRQKANVVAQRKQVFEKGTRF